MKYFKYLSLVFIIIIIIGIVFFFINNVSNKITPNFKEQNKHSNLNKTNSFDNKIIKENTNNKNNKNYNNTTITITSKKIPGEDLVCSTPYIVNKNGCCLDLNNNKICDKDEAEEKKEIENFLDNSFVEEGCGDNICQQEEKNNCCEDCGCPEGSICTKDNECISISEIIRTKDKGNSSSHNGDEIKENRNITISFFGLAPIERISSNFSKNNKTKNQTNKTFIPVEFVNTKLKPMFYENLSTTDYIVVTLDSVRPFFWYDEPFCHKLFGKTKCYSDYYNELFIYTQAGFTTTDFEEKQRLVYPLGRAGKSKAFVSGDYFITPNNPLPIFALEKDEIKNNIIIKILVSEADEKTTLQKINYDLPYNEIKNNFFKGRNDLLFEKTIIIDKNSNFNIGTHTIKSEYAEITYSVREIDVPYDIPVKVKLNKLQIDFSTDEPDISNPAEPILWYRVADNFAGDEFGISTEYDTHQVAGGKELEPLGSPGSPYPTTKQFDNFILFDTDSVGPFLFIETDLYDRDSSCKKITGSVYPCADTDKLEEIHRNTISIIMDNYEFLSDPWHEKTFTYYDNGFKIEVIRGAYRK